MKRVRVFQLLVPVVAGGFLTLPLGAQSASGYNQKGNILIADQYNNRVLEIDPATNLIVWKFGDGSSIAGPNSAVGVNDAERVGSLTLISGTGVPPGGTPFCPNGCQDNRVFLVDQSGRILWQYGKTGVPGSGPNELNTPVQAAVLPNYDVLITDQANARVIEVNMNKQIVWQYGQTGNPGIGWNQLNNPNSAELLPNGDVLIADENNNRVIEVTRAKNIRWEFSRGISGAAFASRLSNGNTLITDSNNNRIVEVNSTGGTVWEFKRLPKPGMNLPTRAVRLSNGNTLISDQNNQQVIEITPDKATVFVQGVLDLPGNSFDRLWGPYDAKVVGDYTGLTPPPGVH